MRNFVTMVAKVLDSNAHTYRTSDSYLFRHIMHGSLAPLGPRSMTSSRGTKSSPLYFKTKAILRALNGFLIDALPGSEYHKIIMVAVASAMIIQYHVYII